MDFLLLVLRKLLCSNSRYVKVRTKDFLCLPHACKHHSCSHSQGSVFQIILMSATINCKQFADYFATPVHGKMNSAYVFEVKGTSYAIEDFYLDDLRGLFPYQVQIWASKWLLMVLFSALKPHPLYLNLVGFRLNQLIQVTLTSQQRCTVSPSVSSRALTNWKAKIPGEAVALKRDCLKMQTGKHVIVVCSLNMHMYFSVWAAMLSKRGAWLCQKEEVFWFSSLAYTR